MEDYLSNLLDELFIHGSFNTERLKRIHSSNPLSTLLDVEKNHSHTIFNHTYNISLDEVHSYASSTPTLIDGEVIDTWDKLAQPQKSFVSIDYDALGEPTDEQLEMLRKLVSNHSIIFVPTIAQYLVCKNIHSIDIDDFDTYKSKDRYSIYSRKLLDILFEPLDKKDVLETKILKNSYNLDILYRCYHNTE